MFTFGKMKAFFGAREQLMPPPRASAIIAISTNAADTPEELQTNSKDFSKDLSDEIGFAEGQSFIIEYVDAKGNLSIRRVTAWGLSKNKSGVPVITAKCHERNALRSFRLDRIRSVIDFDGVVEPSVSSFMIETFGMHPDTANMADTKNDSRSPHKKNHTSTLSGAKVVIRERGIHLLWCFANADDDFDPKELEVIVKYSELCCLAANVNISPADQQALKKYLRNLRPTGPIIDQAIENLTNGTSKNLELFLNYCIEVANADGLIHTNEIIAINTISRELIGRDLLS